MRSQRFTPTFTASLLLTCAVAAVAQDTAGRTVEYHSQDIVAIRSRVKYTTLIELPATEKIMEVHPAKAGISSNLNLITDKGNIYSFTLQDVSAVGADADLKVLIVPSDRSALVASQGPAQFVPATQLAQAQQQLTQMQAHITQEVDSYKSQYPMELKFDYSFKSAAPFDIQSIYHDDKFTYIKSNAAEKFSIYEMRDGKPNLIAYELREGTYIIPKVMTRGYVELGKKRMEFKSSGKASKG
jgi:type IV secretory pathway VirB9-like protein